MASAEEIHRLLEDFTAEAAVAVVTNVHANLQEDTPVATGWARANWVPSVLEPFEGTAGSREQAEAGQIDQGPAQTGLVEVLGFRLADRRIWISNNVPYIGALNDGHSPQAAPGFVETDIDRGIRQGLEAVSRRAR